MNLHNFIEFIN